MAPPSRQNTFSQGVPINMDTAKEQPMYPDFFDMYGRRLIKDRDEKMRGLVTAPIPVYGDEGVISGTPLTPQLTADSVIGIVGAGPAGMYAALILDSLDIKYEILEASPRAGGRLHTYQFTPSSDPKLNGTHDYYDLGAMRYPETPIMKRTFDLFKYPPLNTGDIQVEKHRIPYYFDTKDGNGIMLYNGKRHRVNDLAAVRKKNGDPFDDLSIGVPPPYIRAGFAAIFRDVISRFASGLEIDLETKSQVGWEIMMAYDSYSTRAYMTHEYMPSDSFLRAHKDFPIAHLPTNVVNWMETMDKTTGWYDRALTTTVLEEVAFGFTTKPNQPPVKYSCLDGGSEVLTLAMQKYIEKQAAEKWKVDTLHLNHRCVKIAMDDPTKGPQTMMNIEVHTPKAGDPKAVDKTIKTYDHVISTAPLTCLRHTIDISGCGLNSMQFNALRQLAYTPAVKVGMKFRSAWWTGGKAKAGGPVKDKEGNVLNIIGGRSFTDRPIRVVVYPSYGLWEADGKTPREGPSVLISSFMWTEDAARIGGLIGTGQPDVDRQLRDLVLEDLAAVHNVDIAELDYQLLDVYSVDWADNPLTMGAFALFGPGKFGDVYTSLTVPAANGKLHFAGEAVSTRHGWVVGALDSAWRCINEILLLTAKDKLEKFYKIWGVSDSWVKDPNSDGTVPENDLLLEHLITLKPELKEMYDAILELGKALEEDEEAEAKAIAAAAAAEPLNLVKPVSPTGKVFQEHPSAY